MIPVTKLEINSLWLLEANPLEKLGTHGASGDVGLNMGAERIQGLGGNRGLLIGIQSSPLGTLPVRLGTFGSKKRKKSK